MLTVTTPADETKLTTLKDAIRYLGLAEDCDVDVQAKIDFLIKAVGDAARSYTGREFSKQTYQETLPAYGTPYLRVSERPIISVTAITRDGTPVDSTSYKVENPEAGLIYAEGNFTWFVASERTLGGVFPLSGYEAPKYQVTYVAGWLLPGETGRTLPHDIEFAVLEALRSWRTGDTTGGPLRSIKVGPVEETYAVDSSVGRGADEFPPETIAILSRYRILDRALV